MAKRILSFIKDNIDAGSEKPFAVYFSRSEQVLKETYDTISAYLDQAVNNANALQVFVKGQDKAIDQLVLEKLLEMGFDDNNPAPADLKADVHTNVQSQIPTHRLDRQKLSVIVSGSQPFPKYDQAGKLLPNRQQDCIDTLSALEQYFKLQLLLKHAGARIRVESKSDAAFDWNQVDKKILTFAEQSRSLDEIQAQLKHEKDPILRNILLAQQEQHNTDPEQLKTLLENNIVSGEFPTELKLAYFASNAYAALASAANFQRKIDENQEDQELAQGFTQNYVSYCEEAGNQIRNLKRVQQDARIEHLEVRASRETNLLGRALNTLEDWTSNCKAFFKHLFKSDDTNQSPSAKRPRNQ